jgi:hypothetical protein
MSDSNDSNPSGATVRLGYSGGLGGPLTRAVTAAAIFGVLGAAVPGGLGLRNSHGGWIGLLGWALFVSGLLVVLAASVFLAVGWWVGRSAELTPQGIRLSTWRGRRTIPWSAVQRCEIRTADSGRRRMLVAWPTPEDDDDPAGTRMLWLGDVTHVSIPEPEVTALVHRWMDG